MKCVLHMCQDEGKICDPTGACPDGYTNYLGTCFREHAEGCRNLSFGCPSYTLCNKKDKNCYVKSCWRDGDCQGEKGKLNVGPHWKCLRSHSIGPGHCYK